MGPMGLGPRTGRGMGQCRGGISSSSTRQGLGFGMRQGWRDYFQGWFGSGGGWRHCFFATGMPRWMRFQFNQTESQSSVDETERQILQQQAKMLKEELARIEERLKGTGKPETQD